MKLLETNVWKRNDKGNPTEANPHPDGDEMYDSSSNSWEDLEEDDSSNDSFTTRIDPTSVNHDDSSPDEVPPQYFNSDRT